MPLSKVTPGIGNAGGAENYRLAGTADRQRMKQAGIG
jgi:hypothetical protein